MEQKFFLTRQQRSGKKSTGSYKNYKTVNEFQAEIKA